MIYNPNFILLKLLFLLICLGTLIIYALSLSQTEIEVNLLNRLQPPSQFHLLGTDNLGRDLWNMIFQSIDMSLKIGIISSVLNGLIAIFLSGLSLINKFFDNVVRGIIDGILALPQLLLLILICFTFGGGISGVILAIGLTHWPKLALILRSELMTINQSEYIKISKKVGIGVFYRVVNDYLPIISPQWVIGVLFMFPHTILHSAALSFLGFGLSPHEPSLGVLLFDALRYLNTGAWWLIIFPGIGLFGLVLLFGQLAKYLQLLLRG